MVAPYLVTPTTEVLHPLGEFASATVRVTDYDTADTTRVADMAKTSTPVSEELTAELDGAAEWLDLPVDEILLAALTRTIARTLGTGVVPIDIASERGSLLDAVPLICATAAQASATEVLAGVHRALAGAGEHVAAEPSEVYLNYIGEAPHETVPVEETPPGLGHALEVRVYRAAGDVHVDWWYDTSRFEDYTVEELAEQFPLALIEMTSDALPPQ
ncbi:hypothetical protein [Mycobacterium sp. IDR2000157661]|uniref:hypothetical protein n=1 Tax=Mycobacterium sp. IDR2000157661 TaxID=2867005 RepID=UPI001EEA1716|nr:hypothetical protein [Mycobacterium sp. IDR2000157661]ULE32686.1 hypothetical protein K3G64_21775 [Mycobacterium sp. IDR2000157661]